MKKLVSVCLMAILVIATDLYAGKSKLKIDSAYTEYSKVAGVAGSIKSVGSDTMNNLMTLWGEAFLKTYPNAQIEIEGKGSSTAPPALIAGTSTFGPMSRKMKDKEEDAFEKKFGYKPQYVRTAIDMLAVYVHRDNPIAKKGLTLKQVDAIFSKTRKGGGESDITTWGQLGLTGEWANKPISLYGRNSASGTYGYFKKHALYKGDYKDSVKEQPGSASVVQGVANDKYAIGYSGIGYKTADVAAVSLKKSGDYIPADATRVSEYPLARYLHVYVNYRPGAKLDPLRAEFLKYIFSKGGQQDVIRDGYLPVSVSIARTDLKKLGITMKTASHKN